MVDNSIGPDDIELVGVQEETRTPREKTDIFGAPQAQVVHEDPTRSILHFGSGAAWELDLNNTYTVDDARFEVVAGLLRLKAGESLDHETEAEVTLTLTATDPDGASTQTSVTVAVADLNDAPEGLTLTQTGTLYENTGDQEIGTLAATDADGDALTYTVDDARFEVVAGLLRLKAGESLDHETEAEVTLTLTATDPDGASTQTSVTVAVADLNDAPEGLSVSQSYIPQDGLVLWLDGSDLDGDLQADGTGTASSTWVDKSGTAGTIELTGTEALQTADGVDFSGTDTGYKITSYDELNKGTFTQKSFAVSFTAGDDLTGNQMIYEQGGTTRGYNLMIGPDPDTGEPTLWATAYNRSEWDAGYEIRTINLGTVTTGETYEIVLVHDATSADPLEQTLTAYLGGEEVDQIDHVGVQYNHSNSPGIGLVSSETVNPLTGFPVNNDLMLFKGTVGEVMVWNNALSAAEVSDLDSYMSSFSNQTDSSNVSVAETAEAGTIVATLAGIDKDGDTLSYQFVDSDGVALDHPLFEIDGDKIKLKAGASLDYETTTSYDLNIVVSDPSGETFTDTITIDVTNINEGPESITISTDELNDEALGGAVLAQFAAIDPENAGDITFIIVDEDDREITHDLFEIVDGDLILRDGASLADYTDQTLSFRINAIDATGSITYANVTMSVIDGNVAPSDITLSHLTMPGELSGAEIGLVTVTDTDAGDSHSYTVSDARFEVVDGILKLKDGQSLDPSETNVTIELTATDSYGESYSESFNIEVEDDALAAEVITGFVVTREVSDGTPAADVDWESLSETDKTLTEDAILDAVGGTAETVMLEGYFDAPSDGSYDLTLPSGEVIALIDGVEIAVPEGGGLLTLDLTEGTHEISVRMVLDAGTPEQTITLSGADLPVGPLTASEDILVEENGILTIGIDLSGPTRSDLGFRARYFEVTDGSTSVSDFDWSETAGYTETLQSASLGADYGDGWSSGSSTTYAAQIAGYFDADSDGTYSFTLGADDGAALYIDGERVLDNSGGLGSGEDTITVDLTSGLHTVEIRSVGNQSGSGLSLTVTEPGETEATDLLPAALPPEEADMTPTSEEMREFTAEYFHTPYGMSSEQYIDWNATPVHTETLTEVYYAETADSFWSGGNTDLFAAKITGEIDMDQDGYHFFALGADDGAVLYIDGIKVVDNDGDHAYKYEGGAINLSAGTHTFEIHYYENYGLSGLSFYHSSTGSTDPNDWALVEAPSDTSAVSLDAAEVPPDPTYAIEGLPADTILISGDNVAVVGSDPVDVTGWDLSQLEIAPPPGVTGEIAWRLTSFEAGYNGSDDKTLLGPVETITIETDDVTAQNASETEDQTILLEDTGYVATGWDDAGTASEAAAAEEAAEADPMSDPVDSGGTEAQEEINLDPV